MPQIDPDRRAWHRAQAAAATRRGGRRGAGAVGRARAGARRHRRGCCLSRERGDAHAGPRRARAPAARGGPGQARRRRARSGAASCVTAAEAGPLSALQAAEIEHLRGEIAFDNAASAMPHGCSWSAAKRLEPLDASSRAGRTSRRSARRSGPRDLDSPGACSRPPKAARAAPPAPDPPGAVDVVLDAFAVRLTDGYAAAAPALRRALETVLALKAPAGDLGRWLWLTGARATGLIAIELWDADAWHELASRQVQVARDAGALVQLQFALNFFARSRLASGRADRCRGARRGGAGDRAGGRQLGGGLRGDDARGVARPGVAGVRADRAHGAGGERARGSAGWSTSRPTRRRCSTTGSVATRRRATPRGRRSSIATTWATARSSSPSWPRRHRGPAIGRSSQSALEWMSERTRVTRTDWVLGIEARVRALLSEGDAAEREYRESIERLGRTRLRLELARGHLLYGEWLRRERRRVDAREQLRTAHELFDATGADGFAERARHELLATGETVRKRRDDTRDELTPQEEHIARLALAGRTNPEIGAELFLSPRTVEWHLKKVFMKLGISSRKGLPDALPARGEAVAVA